MYHKRTLFFAGAITLIVLCLVTLAVTALGAPWFVFFPFSGMARSDVVPQVPDTTGAPFHKEDVPIVSAVARDISAENTFPLWTQLADDDPAYGLTVVYEVHYADGTTAAIEWLSWRYGFVVGPVVIVYGDGPPGEVTLLDTSAPSP